MELKDLSHFNGIVIIESLRKGDSKTGRRLYDELESWGFGYDITLFNNFYNVETKKEFFNIIHLLEKKINTESYYPILHLETHGSKEGIELTKDKINWQELFDGTRKLNIATQNNLLIVLAACNGAHAYKKVLPSKEAPFCMLLGPAKTVNMHNIDQGFQVFYQEILKTKDYGIAIKKLNDKINNRNRRFYHTSCRDIFEDVVADVLKSQTSRNRIETREQLLTDFLERVPQTMDITSTRKILKDLMKNKNIYIEKIYDRFMMLDRFPQNRSRFPNLSK